MAGNKQRQVIDVRASKGMSQGQSNEHLRIASKGAYKNMRSKNFDPSRERLDFEIQEGKVVPLDKKNSICERIKKNMQSRKIYNPNAGLKEPRYRVVADFILGGSRDQMRKLAFGNQDVDFEKGANNSRIERSPEIEKWAVGAYNFMANKYGEKNIVAFVVHLDELNPHVHCTVLPVTEKNKISWRKVMVGEEDSKEAYRRNMIQLHNEFAEFNKSWGLERGEPISETNAKHRTTEQYHEWRRTQLQSEIERQREEINQQNNIISGNNNIIGNQEKKKKTLEQQIRSAEIKLKSLNTMIANLEIKKSNLEEEYQRIDKDLETGRLTIEQAASKRQEIEDKIADIEAKIYDKIEKLNIAKQELGNLIKDKDKTSKDLSSLKHQVEFKKEELELNQLREMQSTGWNMLSADIGSHHTRYMAYRETLSPAERDVLDKANEHIFGNSFISDIAENASEVTAVATALFLGYIDKATEISQSVGGGAAPNSGWGRDKDEDDFAFRRRCMLMGMHMLKDSKLKRSRKL